jgi:SEC-C motif-containing protein
MNNLTELDNRLCFCGSGLEYGNCCGPIIAGEQPAASAEQLMRSRYSAYVMEDRAYLLKSWHPDTRPAQLDLGHSDLHWIGLSVRDRQGGQPGDHSGRVSFIARYEQGGVSGAVQENSRFVCEQGAWLYVDGDLQAAPKPGRNDPCPCGSGKKYKKCCAG